LNRFLESVMFLIGGAYFVAGSYPENLSHLDLDSTHSVHVGTGNTTHGEAYAESADVESGDADRGDGVPTPTPLHNNDEL
jgi:hypothetical protein